MWYYIIAFVLSLLGIYFADQYYKNKILFVFYSFIALAPTVIIAGFRFHTIGSDTDFYILPYLTRQQNFLRNLVSFLRQIQIRIFYIYFIRGLSQE